LALGAPLLLPSLLDKAPRQGDIQEFAAARRLANAVCWVFMVRHVGHEGVRIALTQVIATCSTSSMCLHVSWVHDTPLHSYCMFPSQGYMFYPNQNSQQNVRKHSIFESAKCVSAFLFVLRFWVCEKNKNIAERILFPMCTFVFSSVTHSVAQFSFEGEGRDIFPAVCAYAYSRPGRGSPRHNTGTEEMIPREAGFHVFPSRVSCFPFYALANR
jgi:hypothetical protein